MVYMYLVCFYANPYQVWLIESDSSEAEKERDAHGKRRLEKRAVFL